MKQILEEENIDPRMIIFIDAITLPSGGKTDDSDRCLYLSDLRNLSDLAVIIDEAHNFISRIVNKINNHYRKLYEKFNR